MLQTGFLTLKDYDPDSDPHTLGYPNWEVQKTFASMILTTRLRVTAYAGQHVIAYKIRTAIQNR